MIHIVIPEPSPSLNELLKMHWGAQKRQKDQWAWMFLVGFGAKPPQRATCRRRLTIERHGKKALDHDNLLGGAKRVITDNLVKWGLLVDDTDAWVEFAVSNVLTKKGEKAHTVITLEDLSS